MLLLVVGIVLIILDLRFEGALGSYLSLELTLPVLELLSTHLLSYALLFGLVFTIIGDLRSLRLW